MLRKSEIKPLISEIEMFKNELEFDERKTRTEVIEIDGEQLILFDGKPLLFKAEGQLIPTLFFERYIASAPKIAVDRGAIPHICNGADVMAPGVRNIEKSFPKEGFVVVVDETHGKPLAVGRALLDSETMRRTERGSIVKTLHYVGDKIYNTSKALQEP
jgi:PUA domain protein